MIVGFVRFLLILGVVYLGYKIIRHLMRSPGREEKDRPADVKGRRDERRKVSRDIGEYVDYEEVDDDGD